MTSPLAVRVCDIGSKGLQRSPFGGGHPHAWRRLGLMMTRLFRGVVSDGDPDAPSDQFVDYDLWMQHNSAFHYGTDIDIALNNFCEDVAALAQSRLDCQQHNHRTNVPLVDPKTGQVIISTDQDLRPVGIDDTPSDYPPRPLPRRAHREVQGQAFVHYLNLHLEVFSPSRPKADVALHAWQPRVDAAFAAVDPSLGEEGGYFIHYFRAPDRVRQDVSGVYVTEMRADAFIRTSTDYDLDQLPEWRRLSRFAVDRKAPWGQTQLDAMVFWDAGDDASAVEMHTSEQTLDYYFDLRSAREGTPDAVGLPLATALCYLQPRLEKRGNKKLTLPYPDQLPFVLDFDWMTDAFGQMLGEPKYTPLYTGSSQPTSFRCRTMSRPDAAAGKGVTEVYDHKQPIDVQGLLVMAM